MSQSDEIRTLAAVVGRQSLDLNVHAGFLLDALAGALPEQYVTVQRKRSIRRRGDAPVLAVSVRLGEHRYVLERSSATAVPSASVGHEVGGVVLSTKVMPLHEWSYRLAGALADLARDNVDVTAALQRITSFQV